MELSYEVFWQLKTSRKIETQQESIQNFEFAVHKELFKKALFGATVPTLGTLARHVHVEYDNASQVSYH